MSYSTRTYLPFEGKPAEWILKRVMVSIRIISRPFQCQIFSDTVQTLKVVNEIFAKRQRKGIEQLIFFYVMHVAPLCAVKWSPNLSFSVWVFKWDSVAIIHSFVLLLSLVPYFHEVHCLFFKPLQTPRQKLDPGQTRNLCDSYQQTKESRLGKKKLANVIESVSPFSFWPGEEYYRNT